MTGRYPVSIVHSAASPAWASHVMNTAAACLRSAVALRIMPIPPPPVATPAATSDGTKPAPTANFAFSMALRRPPVLSWAIATSPLVKSVMALLAM